MVSIKSLAVILFAAAVTAIPLAGKDDHPKGHGHGSNVNAEDNSKSCGKQEQNMYCCNDASLEKSSGPYTGVLDGLNVKCNNIAGTVLAGNVLSGASQCNGKMACCSGETEQNGVINLTGGCFALAGLN